MNMINAWRRQKYIMLLEFLGKNTNYQSQRLIVFIFEFQFKWPMSWNNQSGLHITFKVILLGSMICSTAISERLIYCHLHSFPNKVVLYYKIINKVVLYYKVINKVVLYYKIINKSVKTLIHALKNFSSVSCKNKEWKKYLNFSSFLTQDT